MSVTEQHIPEIGVNELRALQGQLRCATQAEFAAYLGVTQAYVSDLLTGKKTLKPGPLLKLIERLQQH
jgi:hypothetical protein